jgi:phosphatidylethanolamine/phosphatidyl-N-methylethanolamine N-methyltransferase
METMNEPDIRAPAAPMLSPVPHELDEAAVRVCYRRVSRFYDLAFGATLGAGRREAMRRMQPRPGLKILEIGVGTGLSLPLYPAGVSITGIDLSGEMLRKAERRVAALGRSGVELRQMDARQLAFANEVFDVSVAMYVASVTPDPEVMVAEMRRVTRPGGEIYIVNHFSRKRGVMALIERGLSPLSSLLGFKPVFFLDEFQTRCGIDDCMVHPVPPFGYWLVLKIQNGPNGAAK